MSARWGSWALAAWVGAVLAMGCRTELKAMKREDPHMVYVGDKTCNVYDFAGATDVPSGAKNLGWIEVKKAGSDEDTFLKLREKACEIGADGLSSMAWVRDTDDYEPSLLRANAWSLP